MSKSQSPIEFLWQSTSPVTGFLPAPGPGQTANGNSPLTGSATGTMSGTNVVYSNIVGMQQWDNVGLEIAWTGSPTGTILILGSNSGVNFPSLTFNPTLSQPAGSAGSFLIDLTGYPFRYLMIQYTNATGTGAISAYGQAKANNV